jgi:hypothetical protein
MRSAGVNHGIFAVLATFIKALADPEQKGIDHSCVALRQRFLSILIFAESLSFRLFLEIENISSSLDSILVEHQSWSDADGYCFASWESQGRLGEIISMSANCSRRLARRGDMECRDFE